MRFLIVEDDIYFAKELKSMIENAFQDIIIDIYTSITEEIDIRLYEAFFLDLEIGEQSGFEFAKVINNTLDEDRPIIFVTSHVELWRESFEYHPFWYIDKSRYQYDLEKMFVHLKKKLEFAHAYIEVEYDQGITRIELRNILYLYKDGNYIYIHTSYHVYKIYMSLKNLMKQMIQKELFIKINSGTLINKKYIKEYHNKDSEVMLKNGEVFTVSRSCRKSVKELFGGKR